MLPKPSLRKVIAPAPRALHQRQGNVSNDQGIVQTRFNIIPSIRDVFPELMGPRGQMAGILLQVVVYVTEGSRASKTNSSIPPNLNAAHEYQIMSLRQPNHWPPTVPPITAGLEAPAAVPDHVNCSDIVAIPDVHTTGERVAANNSDIIHISGTARNPHTNVVVVTTLR